MDVDVSGEISRGECQDTGDGIEHSGVSVGEDAWEEYGCILWDLAASKTHAELMVYQCWFLVCKFWNVNCSINFGVEKTNIE